MPDPQFFKLLVHGRRGCLLLRLMGRWWWVCLLRLVRKPPALYFD